MYKIKQQPSDFIVKEVSNLITSNKGKYTYFKLHKENWNTLDAVRKISQILNLPEKDIGFAGNKDKAAITEQFCSIKGNISKERLENININGIKLIFLGYGEEPITLGRLTGNEFIIVVRNLEKISAKYPKTILLPNYFDEQRFGENNAEIGRALIKKDFRKALDLINYNKSNEHLNKAKNDFIGALKKIPIRLLRFYINAYQSYLWNLTLAKYLEENGKVTKKIDYSLGQFVFTKEVIKNLKITLIGFDDKIIKLELKKIVKEIMKKEEITFNDFIIKQIPELSQEGELREAFFEVSNLNIKKLEKDEFNPNKYKTTVSFTLSKGSYATIVIKYLFALTLKIDHTNHIH